MRPGDTFYQLLLLTGIIPLASALPQSLGNNAVTVANSKPGRKLTGKFLHITGM
jgi:hypothetical protein